MGEWREAQRSFPPSEQAAFFRLAKPVVEMSRGMVTTDGILEDRERGLCHIWFSGDFRSIAILRFKAYRSGLRILQIDLGAGILDDFIDLVPIVEDLARSQGCHRLQIEGRAGWHRALTRAGVAGLQEISRTIGKEV